MHDPNLGRDPALPPEGIPGQVPNPGRDPIPDQPIDPTPDRPIDPAPPQPIDPVPDQPSDPVQFRGDDSAASTAFIDYADPMGTPGSIIP